MTGWRECHHVRGVPDGVAGAATHWVIGWNVVRSVDDADGGYRDPYGDDLYDEADGSTETLAHLGPLAPMAGVWEGVKGYDLHPSVTGPEGDTFVEHYDLQPIDRQTNGPQLFYGLRYHTHIVRPGETETFHDQVGYWLWEPSAHLVTFTLSIPRGQVLLAAGAAEATSRHFVVSATLGSETHGILSNPFLDRAFRTRRFEMSVSIHEDGTWSYDEVAELEIPGQPGVFRHVDANTLTRVASPSGNPLAGGVAGVVS